MSQPLKLITRL